MTDIGLLGALFGGILSLVSPCSALLLPSFFAYAFDNVGRLLARTAVFWLGLAVVLVPLGAGVGAVGSLVTQYRGVVTTVGGVLLIVLGVLAILGKGFAFAPAQRAQGRIKVSSTASVFALGAVYGLAGFCAGPLLGAVLTVAATGGQASYGGLLMAVYAFGMALPLFVLALLWERFDLGNRGWLRGREIVIGPLRTHTTALISGLLFIGIGLLFLLTDGTANLGGVVGVDGQFSMQVWLGEISDKVPDTTLVIGLLLLAALAVGANALRRRRAETRAEAELSLTPGQEG